MTAVSVEVIDNQVRESLRQLKARVDNMQPLLRGLAEGITERTKHRFDTSTAPDETPWAPNSAATLQMLAERLAGSKSNRKKDGSLNAMGARALANKRPLIDSGFLRQNIVPESTADALTVTATAAYAAIQQWGGKAGRGLKVSIPARPYMPLRADGTLYPQESELILQNINSYLTDGLLD